MELGEEVEDVASITSLDSLTIGNKTNKDMIREE